MADTAGIIFSAVMVFIIGLITLLFGALTMSVAVSGTSGTGFATEYFGAFAIPAAIALIALGGWSFAAGLGIFRMREWARKSMLAFGAILFMIAVFGVVELVLNPDAGLTSLEGFYLGTIRVELLALFGWIAALGAFWLYFFSSKSVKARFLG